MTEVSRRVIECRAIRYVYGPGELRIEDGGYQEWTEVVYAVPRVPLAALPFDVDYARLLHDTERHKR